MEKPEKLLPLGSLVKIDEKLKRVMIIGFYVKNANEPDKIYDYMGCIYPNGVLINTQYFVFNQEDIQEVCVLGYSDQEEKEFKRDLKTKIAAMENK